MKKKVVIVVICLLTQACAGIGAKLETGIFRIDERHEEIHTKASMTKSAACMLWKNCDERSEREGS